jgi:hypothetical protein
MTSEALPRAFKTSRPVTLSLALWAVLALAVFSIVFDAKTRAAGVDFVATQRARRAESQPLDTIDHGFRPRVRSAAVQSSVWFFLILIGGGGATLVVARSATLSERERFRSRESKGATF